MKKEKKKKKIKMKKKWFLILIIGIIGITTLSLIGYNQLQKNTLKQLKKIYNEYVITTKNTSLYNKNGKKIGTITKNIPLQLEKIKKITIKNKYLNIEGTDYYISYKDIKKNKITDQKKEETYLLPLNKEIQTKNKVTLKEEGKDIITLNNGIKTKIESMDDKNYYVRFQNQLLSIKKQKNIKEKELKDKIEGMANHISIIHYERIEADCGEDNCLKAASVKAHIQRLKNDGFYFITKDDFIKYYNNYQNVKENAVLLLSDSQNEATEQIKNEMQVDLSSITENDGIKIQNTNKPATRADQKESINAYLAKNYTIIDNYSRMAKGEEVPDNGRENSGNQSIAVLNYHFFFDSSIGEECNESICLEKAKFKEQLQWLQDNGYKTLTIQEFADWKDGIIEIPDKSVLLTIDDGAKGTGAHNGNILIPLLEEYKMHATLFLIAGWWDISNYQSPYLDIQSHTYNLHYEASCSDGRGKVACSNYDEVKADLQQSLDVIRDKTSFCFPFYSYDNESLQAVKDLGFRISFIGGNVKARRSNNNYLIPRYPVLDDISLNGFINMVS